MAKGASIKFKSYTESVSKLLELLKLDNELKKYDKIILKVALTSDSKSSTKKDFAEAVAKFCLAHKNPVAEVLIAEGADGFDTNDLFDTHGFRKLAETYPLSLIDLNYAETEEIQNAKFQKFPSIHYPKILLNSFVISLASLSEDPETVIAGSLSSMLGAYPSEFYAGFFTRAKKKLRKWPIKYSINDILQCKMPDFALIDASEKGSILAGLPFEMDVQAARLLGKDIKTVPYLKLIQDSSPSEKPSGENILT